MGLEIERKFLVDDDSYIGMAERSCDILQYYLSTDADRTVRVRIAGDVAFLTVKGRNHGCVRSEWEYPVPVDDARGMIACCGDNGIAKTRYYVSFGGRVWEVDRFHGRLEGLTVAEVELPSADAVVQLPPFVSREVTDDARYYNSALSQPGASVPVD